LAEKLADIHIHTFTTLKCNRNNSNVNLYEHFKLASSLKSANKVIVMKVSIKGKDTTIPH